MANEFNEIPQKYDVGKPVVSPFTLAKTEWDNRIGNARVQAYNWRMIAFVMGGVALLSVAGLIYLSTRATVVPYVIEVGQDGAVETVAKVNQERYVPKQAQIKHFLNEFILKVRNVSTDPVVYKQNWMAAYRLLTQTASSKMSNAIKEENQVGRLEKRQTVQTQVKVITQMSDKTYQVRWSEEVFEQDGTRTGTYNMTGVFTIEQATPKDEKELINNPLGLYIKDFSWSKEI